VGSREERIGLNEAVFREVNERIEQLAEAFHDRPELLDLVCECGDAACVNRISMSHAEYEELRADPRRFAVYPGHAASDAEELVECRKGYDVVLKNEGAPKRIAERTDPRS
jgi:hypothetical protein